MGTGWYFFYVLHFLIYTWRCDCLFIYLLFFVLQYRNMTTVLTREYLDVRPDGWLDYAAKRIAQLYCVSCVLCLLFLLWLRLSFDVFIYIWFLLVGELRIAKTGLFVKNILIYFCQRSHLFTPGNSLDVQWLETQGIY